MSDGKCGIEWRFSWRAKRERERERVEPQEEAFLLGPPRLLSGFPPSARSDLDVLKAHAALHHMARHTPSDPLFCEKEE